MVQIVAARMTIRRSWSGATAATPIGGANGNPPNIATMAPPRQRHQCGPRHRHDGVGAAHACGDAARVI